MKEQLQFLLKVLLTQKRRSSEEGYTLTELVIVMLIIAILSVLSVFVALGQVNNARRTEAISNASAVSQAQRLYYIENGVFANDYEALEESPTSTDSPFGRETSNYTYEMTTANDSVLVISIPEQDSFPRVAARSFVAGVVPRFVVCGNLPELSTDQIREQMAGVTSDSQCPS